MRQSLGQKVYMIWSLVNDSVSFFKILLYVIKIAKIKYKVIRLYTFFKPFNTFIILWYIKLNSGQLKKIYSQTQRRTNYFKHKKIWLLSIFSQIR